MNKQGFLDDIPLNRVREYEKGLLEEMNRNYPELIQRIITEKKIDESLQQELLEAICGYTNRFKTTEQ